MVELQKEITELSKNFIIEGFKKLRESGDYEKYREIMRGNNIPEFLYKTFTRYEDKLAYLGLVEEIKEKTGISNKKIKEHQNNGIPISKILALYKKDI